MAEASVTIMTKYGPSIMEPSATTEHFAIHPPDGRGDGSWAITHIGTGFCLTVLYPTKRKAVAVAKGLEAQRGTPQWGKWHLGSFGKPSKQTLKAMQKAFASLRLG